MFFSFLWYLSIFYFDLWKEYDNLRDDLQTVIQSWLLMGYPLFECFHWSRNIQWTSSVREQRTIIGRTQRWQIICHLDVPRAIEAQLSASLGQCVPHTHTTGHSYLMMIITMATAAAPNGRALFVFQLVNVFVLFAALLIRQGNGRSSNCCFMERNALLLEKSKIVTCFNLINLFT